MREREREEERSKHSMNNINNNITFFVEKRLVKRNIIKKKTIKNFIHLVWI